MLKVLTIRNYFFILLLTTVALFSTTAVYTSAPSSVHGALFESVRKEILSSTNIEDSSFLEIYLQEIEIVSKQENKEINPHIEYIFVLSGRSSYLKKPVDSPAIKDSEDDYNRMELGIKIARTIVASRLKKPTGDKLDKEDLVKYGPQIIYNGTTKQNETLKSALKQGILAHYPEEKFRILDLESGEENTRGQFKSLKEHSPLSNTSVAIVTHAYHFPRVARMVGGKWHPFGLNTKIHFYLVDRQLQAPGVKEDMVGEVQRLPRYIKQGDLNSSLPKDIFY